MIDVNRAEEVGAHYSELDSMYYPDGSPYVLQTEAGKFIPTPFAEIMGAFNNLLNQGILSPDQVFCDQGCGDGRIVSLMDYAAGMEAIGVELDPEFYEVACDSAQRFGGRIVQGDFADERMYGNTGLDFRGIDVFYNYDQRGMSVARQILANSNPGTVLLFLGHRRILHGVRPEDLFPGLPLEMRLGITPNLALSVHRKP